jgi:hypothetical protein
LGGIKFGLQKKINFFSAMEIIFKTSKDDYKHFYRQYYKKKIRGRIIISSIFSLILGNMSAGVPFKWFYFFLGTIGSFGVLIFLSYQIPYRRSISWLNQLILNDPGMLGNQKISIVEDGLMLENPTKSGTWNWESIYSIYNEEQYIYILFFNDRKILIPKAAFLNKEDVVRFWDNLCTQRNNANRLSPRNTLHKDFC